MKRTYLTARFDVTDLSEDERNDLATEVYVQHENSDTDERGHPDIAPPEITVSEEEACSKTAATDEVSARLAEMLESKSDPEVVARLLEMDAENALRGVGRGPTGKLRNFRQMRDGKLLAVLEDVRCEGGDIEALEAISGELSRRGL